MNPASITPVDLVGLLVGFTFTLFVFSYIVGDNPIYRLTIHIFVGVTAGYVAVVTFHNVILPNLILPLVGDNQSLKILAVIYLLPSALVLTKMSSRLSKLGNPAIAILVGIGAAAAIGGAVFGTVAPQVAASINIFETQSNPLLAAIILLGTLATLIYFQFGVQRRKDKTSEVSQVIQWIGLVGQGFIAITFGAIFAGVYFSALAALIERLSFIWEFLRDYLIGSILA